MENINLADASEKIYASGLHILEVGRVVNVPGDINVAKLYWQ
jgi:hypothetical protein